MDFTRPESLTDIKTHYCPGCGHGIVHRMIAETMDELGIRKDTLAVISVGCTVLMHYYYECDTVEAAHGRCQAVATGVKRCLPDKIVFGYQGDGDAAAIGMAETIHAANRGENITVIVVNIAIYGMTGGQMSPMTMVGQKTTTSPKGRNEATDGGPLHLCELLSNISSVKYLERVAVSTPKDVIKAKKAVKKAFQNQIDGKGYSMVEILSMCPTDWKVSTSDAVDYVNNEMKN
jgi:2-oxoglutarate ferredoxin oxidoreductase subunit beta